MAALEIVTAACIDAPHQKQGSCIVRVAGEFHAFGTVMVEPAGGGHITHCIAQTALGTRIGAGAVDREYVEENHLSRFKLNPNGFTGLKFTFSQGLGYGVFRIFRGEVLADLTAAVGVWDDL